MLSIKTLYSTLLSFYFSAFPEFSSCDHMLINTMSTMRARRTYHRFSKGVPSVFPEFSDGKDEDEVAEFHLCWVVLFVFVVTGMMALVIFLATR